MVSRPEPRVVLAGNAGPFTLDGTRTYLVGRQQVALIDPGPNVEEHVRALIRSLEGAEEIRVLLTHAHGDHAGAARTLAARVGATVLGPPSVEGRYFGGKGAGEESEGIRFRRLKEGDTVPTDQGDLVVLETPGHTVDHLGFRWTVGEGVFVGDLLLGRGSTTWLGEYLGCVGDYLASLRRVRAVRPKVLFPSHGPPLTSPEDALDRFDAHRRARLAQLQRVRALAPDAQADDLVALVYGDSLPPETTRAARASIEVMLHHLMGDAPRG